MNDEQHPIVADESDGPLPNRLTRGTLMGCVGLVGVMALPLLLFLPLESWGLSRWAFLLIQLLAFVALGGGIWLLAHVPSTARIRSNDPMYPLTARGAAPVRESPAGWPNHVGVAVVWALLALAIAGFAVAAFDTEQDGAVPIGMAIVCLAGASLAVYGLGIALGRLEPPAVHWVRTPAIAGWFPQGGAVTLMGLTLLAWALLIAAEDRLIWGAIGLVALLLAILLVTPLFRQLHARGRG
ncbi:MAG TPA: hypothetical protein VFS83_07015 [Ktedonobacterales bacterium]|nr:hypothetical protein [Ktedonobacterales bacterium]